MAPDEQIVIDPAITTAANDWVESVDLQITSSGTDAAIDVLSEGDVIYPLTETTLNLTQDQTTTLRVFPRIADDTFTLHNTGTTPAPIHLTITAWTSGYTQADAEMDAEIDALTEEMDANNEIVWLEQVPAPLRPPPLPAHRTGSCSPDGEL